MKRYGQPKIIVTDRFRSYRAAMSVIGNIARQECGGRLNNRTENSHQPFRRREKAMAKSWTIATLQKFASVHASIHCGCLKLGISDFWTAISVQNRACLVLPCRIGPKNDGPDDPFHDAVLPGRPWRGS